MSDLHDLSRLIADIYDTTLRPDLWPSVLEKACVYVRARSANIIWHHVCEGAAKTFYDHGCDPDYTRSYFETYVHMNPLLPAAVFVEPGISFTVGDLLPYDEFQTTRFFKEWVAPQGYGDLVGVNMERYPTSSAGFSFQLGEEQGAANDDIRRRVELISPHITRSVLIGRHIERANAQVGDYECLLDAHSAGVFLVDESGQLRFANEAGRAMLEDGGIVRKLNGGLTTRNLRAGRLLQDAVVGCDEMVGDRDTVSIALTDEAPRWLADVLPLRSGGRLALGLRHASVAAIFVRRAEIPAASGIEIMAQLYNLRASEIRVLHAIANGGGSSDALASSLGISSETVKSHLKALFAKTGTSRRSDLLREVAAHGGALA